MLRHPTPPLADVMIPRDSWLKLLSGGLEDIHNPKEVWEVAVEAIDEWTRRHNGNGFPQVSHAGYQWKHVFLPPGTLLRTVFRGKNYHCLVDEHKLMYEGQSVSPNGFVNVVGGIRRNAWRSIWVLYPKTTEWKLADTLRTRTRSRPTRARKVPDEPVQAAPPTPAADTSASTLPEPRAHAAPKLYHAAPPTPLAPPQVYDNAGATAFEAGCLEMPEVGVPIVTPGRPALCADDGAAESALARVLLAELLAFLRQLRASPRQAENGANAVGRWPTYSFNASSYATPQMQSAAFWPAARAAPA